MAQVMPLSIPMLYSSSHIPRLRIINWQFSEIWAYSNRQNCWLCAKKVGGRLGRDLVNNKCLKNYKLTPLWNMSLFQPTDLLVVPDDNYTRKQGLGYRARIWLVNNKYLNNQQLTPLWTLRLFQLTKLWVVPDENYTRKKGAEDRGRTWSLINVKTISNWHLCDVWASTNEDNCGLFLMTILRKIRGCNIGQYLVVQSIITVSKIINWHLS